MTQLIPQGAMPLAHARLRTRTIHFAAFLLAQFLAHNALALGAGVLPPCSISFADSVNNSVGSNPCQMAVGDVDGDGNVDAVVGNCLSLDLSVLYGRGNGQMEPEVRMPLGARPGEIGIADIDRDGNADLVVEMLDLDHLEVFWGNGGRTFTSPTSIPSPVGPYRLRVADLDRDGFLDLVLLTNFVQGISVIWGDGGRTLSSSATFLQSFAPNVIEVADLDLDGALDLVMSTCTDSTLYVALGDGTRQLPTATPAFQASGTYLCGMSLGHLNGDEFPDIAVIDVASFQGQIAIAYGTGDGRFTVAGVAAAGQSPIGVAAADFDQDGLDDIAVVNTYSRDVTLLHGGTFTNAGTLPAGACPDKILASDLDGMFGPDLLVMNDCGLNVSIYRSTSSVAQGSVQFEPGSYQAFSGGGTISARLTLPGVVDPNVEPKGAQLVWGDRVLGYAVAASTVDSLVGQVVLEFDPHILDGVDPGSQTLGVIGCDPEGAAFRAESSIRIYPRHGKTLWQASQPGMLPIQIHVPDLSQSRVRIAIFDGSGRRVRTQSVVVDSENLVTWDGDSNAGVRLSSGIYLLRLAAGRREAVCKVVLLR